MPPPRLAPLQGIRASLTPPGRVRVASAAGAMLRLKIARASRGFLWIVLSLAERKAIHLRLTRTRMERLSPALVGVGSLIGLPG